MNDDIEIIEIKEKWKATIVNCMKRMGGRSIALRDIYSEMLNNPLVTEYHKQPWKHGGQPRYQCWIRRCLTDLVNEHKINRIARAIYSKPN